MNVQISLKKLLPIVFWGLVIMTLSGISQAHDRDRDHYGTQHSQTQNHGHNHYKDKHRIKHARHNRWHKWNKHRWNKHSHHGRDRHYSFNKNWWARDIAALYGRKGFVIYLYR